MELIICIALGVVLAPFIGAVLGVLCVTFAAAVAVPFKILAWVVSLDWLK